MPADKKKYINFYIPTKLLLTSHETLAEIDPDMQTEGTNLSKKAASSLLSSTLCLVPALTWQFISWARDIYTEVPAKNTAQMNEPPNMTISLTHLLSHLLACLTCHILDLQEWRICLPSDNMIHLKHWSCRRGVKRLCFSLLFASLTFPSSVLFLFFLFTGFMLNLHLCQHSLQVWFTCPWSFFLLLFLSNY